MNQERDNQGPTGKDAEYPDLPDTSSWQPRK
ncbi:hypothetical protein LCGC14_2911590, partial [marine sediment metagenome]